MDMDWRRERADYTMIAIKAQKPLDLDGKGERQDGTIEQTVSVVVDGWALYADGIPTGVHVADYDPGTQLEVCAKAGDDGRAGRPAGPWGAPGWGVVSLWGHRLDCGLGSTREEAVEVGKRRALSWWPLLCERLPWREGRDATLKAAQAVGAAVWSW